MDVLTMFGAFIAALFLISFGRSVASQVNSACRDAKERKYIWEDDKELNRWRR